MNEHTGLAERFEEHRSRLQGVAFRMLGSLSEAEDAVQESWVHLSRSGADRVDNLGAWLTTVVSRICLDALRARKSRREELEAEARDAAAPEGERTDPEREAALADEVGLALLVVLGTLSPAERLAFVLHEIFGFPFEEVASVVGRSEEATRQLASRARRRVQGARRVAEAELSEQRALVAKFLDALRRADIEGVVATLDPDVVVRIDRVAVPPNGSEIRGARNWAKGAVTFARGAKATRPVLVDGDVGLVLAPRGRLLRAIKFTYRAGKIAAVEIIADPARLEALEFGVVGSV